MVELSAEQYLMDCVRSWNCKNYYEVQTESTLEAAWGTVKRLRQKCIQVYPDALEGVHLKVPYEYWNWMFQIYLAIQKNRPDIACAYAVDLLHFTAVHGNYEKRVLAVLIRVLEGWRFEAWQPVFDEATRKDEHSHRWRRHRV